MRDRFRYLPYQRLGFISVLLCLVACGNKEDISEIPANLPSVFEINPTVEGRIVANVLTVRESMPAKEYVDLSFLPPSGEFAKPDTAGPKIEITVGLPWIYNDQHAPLYIAKHLGYFEEEGLLIELREGGPGRNPLALLAGGSVDIAISSSGIAVVRMVASSTGADVVAIGAMNRGTGYSWLAMDRATPKEKSSNKVLGPSDFYGSTIGVQEGAEMQMTYFLENFPYLEGKVTFTRAGFTPDALVAGKIDFYAAMYENQPRLIEGVGFKNWTAFRFSDYGLFDYANVHTVMRKTAENEGDMLRRYLRAVGRGIKLMMDDPEQAAAITKNFSTTTQLTEEQILRRFDLQRSLIEPSPEMPILFTPLEKWDRVASQLFTYGEIEL